MFKIPIPRGKSRSEPTREANVRSASEHAAAVPLPRYLQRQVSDGSTTVGDAAAYTVPRFLQAKLAISQPGDAYEQQADCLAEHVMRMPAAAGYRQCTACDGAPPCRACAAEPARIRRKTDAPEGARHASTGGSTLSRLGGGQNLDSATRAFFEPRLGYDFSRVRVHADSEAGQSASDLNARAFTAGQDVVFGPGEYSPSTPAGRQLLAHELVHVIQQGSASAMAPPWVQRKAAPDKHDLTSPDLAGDPILEQCFDGETLVKVFQTGEHVTRLQQTLVKLGFDLPRFGIDGKYGDETAGAVRRFQQALGLNPDGIVGQQTIGQLDRSARNDTVELDEDSADRDFTSNQKQQEQDSACDGKPADEPCADPNTRVIKAAGEAITLIDKTLTQLPPVKDKRADYPAIFSQIFRNNDTRDLAVTVEEVRGVYQKVRNFIARLGTDRSLSRCATECDGGCRSGSPAYHTASTGVITFCPSFASDAERLLIVIHESHHRAIAGSSDKAYADTRLIDKLDHAQALLNAASFHLYTKLVDAPGSQPIGQPIKDANLLGDPVQKKNADLALAFMEQWFKLVTFDTSETVAGAARARKEGHYTENNPQVFMGRVFSPRFGLTAPPAPPSAVDIQKLQAIEDRTVRMEGVFKGPLLILDTSDDSFWERGPGPGVALNARLLSLDVEHMVIALLQELVHATPDISARLEPLYVLAINDMRNLRKLPP